MDRQRYGEIDYTLFRQGERLKGGMMAIAPEWGPVPPHWLIYFAVDDCNAKAATAQRLGASVQVPPTDVPGVGRFAMIRDPQGAVLAIMKFATA